METELLVPLSYASAAQIILCGDPRQVRRSGVSGRDGLPADHCGEHGAAACFIFARRVVSRRYNVRLVGRLVLLSV